MAKKNKMNPKKFFHKIVVIDNSVLLKAFLNEDGSEVVRKLFKMAYQKELTLLAPTLIVFEFLNAMTKSVARVEDVHIALEKFKKLDIGIIDPDDKYVTEAITNVYEKPKISYYDVSYHALAKDMDAIFLTADKKYYTLMKEKGNVELFC